ncbi:MAG: molybdopterin converting factor subunit 1 [Pseudomonadota bacterium]
MAQARTIEILYFARLRDKIGLEAETISLPDTAITVADLLSLVERRSDAHEEAFSDAASIRAALDQEHAEMDAAIGNAKEVAFFPPMTGG